MNRYRVTRSYLERRVETWIVDADDSEDAENAAVEHRGTLLMAITTKADDIDEEFNIELVNVLISERS